jgi:NagD protein
MIVTNNTKKPSREFYEFLKNSGFDIDFSSYLDPLMLLEEHVQKLSVAAYGADEFLQTLIDMGYTLNYTEPETVLIAIKEDFTSDEYAKMIDFLLNGANLVGMHETSLYSKNSKRYPGVGAILKLLEFATSSPYKVVGKPSNAFYNEALVKLLSKGNKGSFADITMISDDVKGDLGGAKELGMKTIFVTSGKYRSKEEIVPFLQQKLRPDEIYKDMQEVLENI